MNAIRASAPGKLFITGEYAVLDHAPALLTAVDVRASCRLQGMDDRYSRVLALPLTAAPGVFRMEDGELRWNSEPVGLFTAAWNALEVARRERLSQQSLHIVLDSSAFFLKDRKLGVGSSAAALTALMGALWVASGGLPVEAEAFATLKQAHDAWQGGGSGGDLAAALSGGTLLYRREPRIVAPVALPEGLEVLPIWSGESASTARFLEKLAEFERREPATFQQRFAVLGKAAEEAALAASSGDGEAFLAAFSGCGMALRALGEAADLPIWSPVHRRIGECVTAAGGAYKPSGAGGGDIGLAVIPSSDAGAMESVKSSLSSAGYHVLPFRFGARGLAIHEG